MEIFKRSCPNCKKELPFRFRLKFIRTMVLDCPSCNYKVQPTAIWGGVMAIMLAPISYKFFYRDLYEVMGETGATIVVIVIALVGVRLLDPLADLQAHHEDERLF